MTGGALAFQARIERVRVSLSAQYYIGIIICEKYRITLPAPKDNC